MGISIKMDDCLKSLYVDNYIDLSRRIVLANKKLYEHSKRTDNMTGWLNDVICHNEIKQIKQISKQIINQSNILIVIGAGGSFLGSKALIEALNSEYYNELTVDTPKIFFIGNNLSSKNISDILKICDTGDVSVNVISKSGTTLEPSIAFRIMKEYLETRYGKQEANKRIYCTTDIQKGALRKIVISNGYTSLEVPKNIGGRYSVLTSVGLLPIAVSGIDIEKIVCGAMDAIQEMNDDSQFNSCYQYAALRYILSKEKKYVELITSFEPCMEYFLEWHKQLFGESLGKNKKGIFPVPTIYTRDLHSIGQFVQDGSSILFETLITFNDDDDEIIIPYDRKDLDELNYICGSPLKSISDCSVKGIIYAHSKGNTPVISISVPKLDAYNLGYLIYFFEKACAINGYLDNINPFDQPGVEEYKQKIYKLLENHKHCKTVICR